MRVGAVPSYSSRDFHDLRRSTSARSEKGDRGHVATGVCGYCDPSLRRRQALTGALTVTVTVVLTATLTAASSVDDSTDDSVVELQRRVRPAIVLIRHADGCVDESH